MLGTELGQRLSVLTYLAVPGTTDATVNGSYLRCNTSHHEHASVQVVNSPQ